MIQIQYSTLVPKITTSIHICDDNVISVLQFSAVWDTGAVNTIISPQIVQALIKIFENYIKMTIGFLIPKIKQIGLIPKSKSKSKKSYHPERIYLLLNKDGINGLLNNSKFNIETPILLTIDVRDIKNTIKLYYDVNYTYGVYTINNIHPKYIVKYDKL